MLTETQVAQSTLNCAPPLTAKLAPWMVRLLQDQSRLEDLVQTHGSPLHLVVGSEFRRNVRDLLSPMRARKLDGGLFFARKANKLPWFVREAKDEGIGVDTASLQELKETLELDVPPDTITVTAVGKERDLVSLAVSRGCIIVVDNHDELNLVQAVAAEQSKSAQIGLRFAGFIVNGRQVFSRFGFAIESARDLIDRIKNDYRQLLDLHLLHAHLDRYDVIERAHAARQLLAVIAYADSRGLKVSAIDLGGGILMRYLNDAPQWSAFQQQLVASVAGEQPSFTYQGDGLGYYKVNDQVLGRADLYPAWNQLSKERFIAAVLDNADGGTPLHKEIAGRDLQLYFEPGRALLDNTGVTLATVTFRKNDTNGNRLVGVAMNRTNLRPFRAEFCSDPIHLSSKRSTNGTECGAFIVGNLCSESDLIFRRRIHFPAMPVPGDLLLFANTAGYLAHHLEVGTHGGPLPTNLLLDEGTFEVLDRHNS
jgi:diaminopimelate decarboxylase